MATTVTQNSVLGDQLILTEIFPWIQKKFSQSSLESLQQMVPEGVIQIDALVEVAMASCNKKLNRIIGAQDGMDFTDGSDAKKATLYYNNSKRSYTACVNVKNKTGTLRVILAIPHECRVVFFKIPYSKYESVTSNAYPTITFYQSVNKSFGKNERYRVNTFKKLCS
jgi:hypothetical protein